MSGAEVSGYDPPPPAPDYKSHYYGNSNQSVTVEVLSAVLLPQYLRQITFL